eukprot:CAMPEP_0171676450 /NCGR_PEP_ID=MMETSP0990-20121206/54441_1 /TAXON_ID=483369 /ORGANISM="non described non described, Strain CCMP2098" /LENGTH=74 /DNA_ID=CAMNT_0012262631 /DNA_START=41 /DNA_END=265 /DNA_ORIENTATION=-
MSRYGPVKLLLDNDVPAVYEADPVLRMLRCCRIERWVGNKVDPMLPFDVTGKESSSCSVLVSGTSMPRRIVGVS